MVWWNLLLLRLSIAVSSIAVRESIWLLKAMVQVRGQSSWLNVMVQGGPNWQVIITGIAAFAYSSHLSLKSQLMCTRPGLFKRKIEHWTQSTTIQVAKGFWSICHLQIYLGNRGLPRHASIPKAQHSRCTSCQMQAAESWNHEPLAYHALDWHPLVIPQLSRNSMEKHNPRIKESTWA